MVKILQTLGYFVFSLFASAGVVYADAESVQEFIDSVALDEAEIAVGIYNFLFPIGLAVGFFAIIMAGYSYLTSQGQPDKVKEASEKLTSAILGIIFIALSLVILRIIVVSLLGGSLPLAT